MKTKTLIVMNERNEFRIPTQAMLIKIVIIKIHNREHIKLNKKNQYKWKTG